MSADDPTSIGLPQVITQFAAQVRPLLVGLVVGSVWLGVTIPLIFILFYFSTPKLRGKPIFVFNVIAIILGILMGVLSMIILMTEITDPLHPVNRPEFLFYTFLVTSADVFIDSVLLFRVYAVFPPARTRRVFVFGLYVPLILLKLARFTNAILFMVQMGLKSRSMTSPAQLASLTTILVEPKLGWVLQLADNAICSSLFLWRLKVARGLNLRLDDDNKNSSYGRKLLTLLWIAASNFVFPVVFIVVQLILMFGDLNSIYALFVVVLSNIYVEIIGVLFATVWAATSVAQDTPHPTTLHSQFAAAPGGSGSTRIGLPTASLSSRTPVDADPDAYMHETFVLHDVDKVDSIMRP